MKLPPFVQRWPAENRGLRLAFLTFGLLALVSGELFAAWMGVPADPISEASFNFRSLVLSIVVVPLGGASLVVYARCVREREAVILAGIGVVAVITWTYVEMLTTNASTAGLGLIALVVYPWPIVGAGWLLSEGLRHRRTRQHRTR